MNKEGLFVSFEGQDGSGKTSVMQEVGRQLQDDGFDTVILSEFSSSPIGDYLRSCVARDKFLRLNANSASMFTQTFAIIADYMYQTEVRIVPELQRKKIVLKDRHIDSQIACQLPLIVKDYPNKSENDLLIWLSKTLQVSPKIPDLTIYLQVSDGVRFKRIEERKRNFAEDRANEISEDDRNIFKERERIYKSLIANNSNRIIIVENIGRIEETAKKVTDLVRQKINEPRI